MSRMVHKCDTICLHLVRFKESARDTVLKGLWGVSNDSCLEGIDDDVVHDAKH